MSSVICTLYRLLFRW